MRRNRMIAAVLAGSAALATGGLAVASGAHAAPTSTCTPVSGGAQYLAGYGDTNSYVLVEGGDFSSSYSPWRLRSSSSIDRTENSDANVTGSTRDGALRIDPGESVVSPSTCVTWNDDRLRFFYKAPAGASLKVSVRAKSGLGSYTVNTLITSHQDGWQLTPEILIPDWTDASGTEEFTLTLSNNSRASVLVDDVLVDPWRVRRW